MLKRGSECMIIEHIEDSFFYINTFENIFTVYIKKYNIFAKPLEKPVVIMYTEKAVTLIAVKREVAARCGRFSAERMSS